MPAQDKAQELIAFYEAMHFSLSLWWLSGKESALERQVQSLGQEKSPGGGNGNLLQYSCLENSMDRGAWQATAHGVTKSQTGLSD